MDETGAKRGETVLVMILLLSYLFFTPASHTTLRRVTTVPSIMDDVRVSVREP